MSMFSTVQPAPSDPILGLTERFIADPRPDKVNLGVGVYQDENGSLPLLRCVDAAEQTLAGQHRPKGYLPIDGLPDYTREVKELVFGPGSPAVMDDRVVTAQALGGTGALRIGADFLHQLSPEATVLVSTPSWENHRALFTRAGFTVRGYRYYDPEAHGIDVDGMLADLAAAPAGTIVVLHACCHNPTGYDLTADQWDRVIDVVVAGGLVPFIDMAYQGFSQGLEEDAAVIRAFAARTDSFLCSSSFSKSFGLYGERVGALSIVCADADEAARVRSQVKVVIRTNYSSPSTHGALLVSTVLGDPQLRLAWTQELAGMRDRIKQMRGALVQGLAGAGVPDDMSFITDQVGMFSYSGLDARQMARLREEFGVYGTDAGRICVAALNPSNVDRVARSIAAVV
ncbi:aspartate/tyrosine/aromatic aminotransferase [Brooklawnia cerclae]|uniref:Aminotransferase n=1 Tax=Brooklawnia cerclae TaxID=349934 RepID=A0ABX0SF53_9ACTN|nr:amino acid aminotransferase [Brooklawnia cerclae]NIH55815.1 aromatic-amino-acid transaminase [Brooklawnia cerclae]